MRSSKLLLLLSGVLAAVSVACDRSMTLSRSEAELPATDQTTTTGSPLEVKDSGTTATATTTANATTDTNATDTNTTGAAVAASPTPAALAPASSGQNDIYQDAINKASSAFNIGQSAHSQDDWRLVASRWQQAIDLMASVPTSHPNHQLARGKITEYRTHLSTAQQQASRQTAEPTPNGVVVVVPEVRPPQIQSPAPQASSPAVAVRPTPVPSPSPPQQLSRSLTLSPQAANPGNRRVFNAPIVRRAGGTPVIRVTFNGTQQYDMIVDTGASGTLITQRMAAALRVAPVGQATVDTASARSVSFPLGYVRSVEVNGAAAQNLLVAIAGPELSVGLLGHDFFGDYDVTIRQDEVEFRER